MKQLTIFFCWLTLCFTNVCHAGETKPYSVFVVPQISALELHKTWTPLLEKLSKATNLQFELKILPTIPEFEHAVFTGEADFAFMNPYHQVVAKQKQGYMPLVRDKKPLVGILLVRNDSPIKNLSELNGKKVAFPAPNAFAASLYMRALLAKQGIEIVPDYVKTHSNTYRAVVLGDVVAGGGVNNTLSREIASVQKQLKVFYTTPESAPHPFSAHPRVSEAVRNKVIASFIELANDPANAALMNGIQIPNPVAADYVRDYLPLESLNLEHFFVEETP